MVEKVRFNFKDDEFKFKSVGFVYNHVNCDVKMVFDSSAPMLISTLSIQDWKEKSEQFSEETEPTICKMHQVYIAQSSTEIRVSMYNA